MRDILDRISDGVKDDTAHEVYCRLIDAGNEIKKLRAALQNIKDAAEPAQDGIVFDRRWRLARDGFGLERDDIDGNYVHIDDAVELLRIALTPNV
jgi:hypothetical protein